MTQFTIQSSTAANAVVEQDRIGGGGYLVETGAYLSKIVHAYIHQSAGGALALNIAVEAGGKTVREIIYFTSGTAKGVKTFYVDKDGNDQPLPGYSKVNSLCLLATDKSIDDLLATVEPKTLMVYNVEAGKEVLTEVQMISALLDQELHIGIVKAEEDKNTQDTSGKWVPSGDTREVNHLERFFRVADKKTKSEITNDTEALFYDLWVAKNAGVTRMDAKGKKEAAGSASAPSGSVFGSS